MNPERLDPAVQNLAECAGIGIRGLVLVALVAEGGSTPSVTASAIEAGRATVEVEIVLGNRGIGARGFYGSHGQRTELFHSSRDKPFQIDDDERTLTCALDAVEVGLWGLAVAALRNADQEDALEIIDEVRRGAAQIQCGATFTKGGASFVGHFVSEGRALHLFTLDAKLPGPRIH